MCQPKKLHGKRVSYVSRTRSVSDSAATVFLQQPTEEQLPNAQEKTPPPPTHTHTEALYLLYYRILLMFVYGKANLCAI
jgi:hypothetical protein